MYVVCKKVRRPYADENTYSREIIKWQREFESKSCQIRDDLHLVNYPSDGGSSFPRRRSFIVEFRETRLQHGVPTNNNESKELSEAF